MHDSLPQLLASVARRRGSQPFLTFYDETSGERTELSYATFDNWASKAANWLVEDHDVDTGQRVDVAADDHWRALVALVACWKVGAAPRLAPGGLVASDDVLAYADDYDDPDVGADDVALVTDGGERTAAELIAASSDVLTGGGRLVSTHALTDGDFVLAVVAVLSAGGCMVWVPGAQPETAQRRAQQERAGFVWLAGAPQPSPAAP